MINGATNAVTATIATPVSDASISGNSLLAVDTASNKIYFAVGQDVYVVDGATKNVTATVPLTLYPSSMVVDSTAHKVYVQSSGAQVVPDGGASPVSPSVLVVIDGTNDTAGTPTTYTDLTFPPNGGGLALDTSTHHLYMCGSDALGTFQKIAVDTLDTSNALAPVGTQQSFTGSAVGCTAGWGGGAIVSFNPGAIDFVDPASVSLPNFSPSLTAQGGSGGTGSVVILGESGLDGLTLQMAAVSSAGATTIAPTTVLPQVTSAQWQAIAQAGQAGGLLLAYVTYLEFTPEGGSVVPVNSVTVASMKKTP